MRYRNKIFIDAGVEHLHIEIFGENERKRILIPNSDEIKTLFKTFGLLDLTKKQDVEIYITGKLAEVVQSSLGKGEIILPGAALWEEAKRLIRLSNSKDADSVGIIDLSASGYTVIAVDRNGNLKNDLLITNPRCGAGTGININRILEKLDIRREDADKILSDYLGENSKEKRANVPVRADRCGVFSSSATISDKNQGIPLSHALAVTMKSEVIKVCKKMLPGISRVYLTGRVFMWQYMRELATDYLMSTGSKEVVYDKEQAMLIEGIKHLIDGVGGDNFRIQENKKLRRPEKLVEYEPFSKLKEKYENSSLFKRLADSKISNIEKEVLSRMPVNIGFDVGSTMAKMIVTDASNEKILHVSSVDNHGDTIETIKHIFLNLKSLGIEQLNIQNIGLTGSGRYQVRSVFQKIYPNLSDRIFVLVENYAHARGSIQYAKDHIRNLKDKFPDINQDFCVLVDIGGEDTKVSVISLEKEELFDNVMNIKCSAGTGSLMDTLKTLFGIKSIEEACQRAYDSPKAYEINATCAVFLMENAKKMQARGYNKDEILASCNYAIVENMARTLWSQIEFPRNAVVLLHGQTMLSDPLPLAVTCRIQENSKMYCLVPPLPGHRACLGLIKSIKSRTTTEAICNLNDFIDLKFKKKIITCHGAACGDKNACCARTMLKSADEEKKLVLTLGGCTAVNELAVSQKNISETVPDAYKEIWEYINSQMPRSEAKDRLIIPRSFAVSEQAYFLSKIFEKIGLSVYVDNIREQDILEAQSFFDIDVCAPLIGVVGQFLRLAKESHGIILVPQIDFLPTQGCSVGKTCTTNQGGMAIAEQHAKLKYPDANFFLFDLSLKKNDPEYIANQLYDKLKKVFLFFGLKVSKREFEDAISFAASEDKKLKQRISDKVTEYLEKAIREKRNISIVFGREYILNPGIYDSHIGKLLRDKGVIAIPSYAFESDLDRNFGYIYWRNPHDLITKINAIVNKKFHSIVKYPKLQKIIKNIETGLTDSIISPVQVSTFKCGPDTVTAPTITEITKKVPSLFIQSDAMIKELAHLENRVNTYINQLRQKLHQDIPQENFEIKLVEEFGFDGLNKETDVIYFPTLEDNRIITSVFRSAGLTAIDNYGDEPYDLEGKIKLGRKYAGDSVCAPMAGIFADILLAVEDFKKRKEANDPLVKDKTRVLIFDIKGSGPCRQGQYFEMHKLLLYKKFGNRNDDNLGRKKETKIGLLVGHERDKYNIGLDEWALIQCFQGLVLQAVLHSLLLKGGADCRNYEDYKRFYADYLNLKKQIYYVLEKKTRPSEISRSISERIGKKSAYAGAIFKYFGYGLYKNNGVRKILKSFSKKWIKTKKTKAHEKIKIHIEGEAYMRVAQVEDIFNSLVDSIGFDSLEITYSPLWCYLELLMEYETLDSENVVKTDKIVLEDINNAEKKSELLKKIREKEKLVLTLRKSIKMLRNILAAPLYKAAGISMPHEMKKVLEKTKMVLPTLKPRGELPPYIGEAILKAEENTKLFLNVAPEGCMVSSMGQLFTEPILNLSDKSIRIQDLFSLNGEIDDEKLRMSLLKTMGPERYYRKNTNEISQINKK